MIPRTVLVLAVTALGCAGASEPRSPASRVDPTPASVDEALRVYGDEHASGARAVTLAPAARGPVVIAQAPPVRRARAGKRVDVRVADARLGDFLRPSLWWVAGPRQVYLASLLTGAFFVETVFDWPGIGRLTTEALLAGDYPLLSGSCVVGLWCLCSTVSTRRRSRSCSLCFRS